MHMNYGVISEVSSVQAAVSHWVKTTPRAAALISDDEALTYQELDTQSTQVAHLLRQSGVTREVIVAVYLDRSVQAIVALLGILKAGGACLPIPIDSPGERLEYILSDSRAQMIVTESSRRDQVASTVNIACVDTLPPAGDCDALPISANTHPDNLAYLIYAPDPSGKGKAVMRTHRAILSAPPVMPLREGDVCCHNVALHVGYSTVASFVPLMYGLPMIVLREASVKDIKECVRIAAKYGVTSIAFVPSILREFLHCVIERSYKLPQLRGIVVYGAALPLDVVKLFERALPNAEMFVGYGASETSVATNARVTKQTVGGAVLIGRSVPGSTVYILDESLNPATSGDVGELYIASPQVARGYLRRPALTAERFVPSPFPATVGERLYRTGDLGRRLENDDIVWIGRADSQVKVRGFRVDPKEVEAVLLRHPQIIDAQVVAEWTAGEAQLSARIQATGEPTTTEIRKYLQEHLPAYMLPAQYIFVTDKPSEGR